jgi:hypothetical protein
MLCKKVHSGHTTHGLTGRQAGKQAETDRQTHISCQRPLMRFNNKAAKFTTGSSSYDFKESRCPLVAENQSVD